MITCEQKTVSVQCFHKFKYCTVGFSVGYSRHIILQHNYTLSMYILKCHFFNILFLVIWHYLVNSFCAFWKQSIFILLTKWHLHSQMRKQDLLHCKKKEEEEEKEEKLKQKLYWTWKQHSKNTSVLALHLIFVIFCFCFV